MNKLKEYGTQGYELMLKPLPRVIKRAVITYWVSLAVSAITAWIFDKINGL